MPVLFVVPNHHWTPQAENLLDSSRWQVRLRRTPPPDRNDNEYHEPEGLVCFWGVHEMPSESTGPFSLRTPYPASAATMPVPCFLPGRMLKMWKSHPKPFSEHRDTTQLKRNSVQKKDLRRSFKGEKAHFRKTILRKEAKLRRNGENR